MPLVLLIYLIYCIIFCSFCGYFAKISLLYQKFLEKYLVGSRKVRNFASSKENNNLLKNINMKNVYRLNRCQLDSKNIVINEQYVGMFSTPERVLAYLTHNGKSHGQLSLLGFRDADQEYILWLIGYLGATLIVHHDAVSDPLLGIDWPATNDYYCVRKYDIDALLSSGREITDNNL